VKLFDFARATAPAGPVIPAPRMQQLSPVKAVLHLSLLSSYFFFAVA
jgi:hypothetical protein